MHILSFFAFILFSICAVSAQYVDLYDFPDGTYAYVKTFKFDQMPSERTQKGYSQGAYDEMKGKAADDGRVVPSTMSASYWPDADGRGGGTMILHSSIKGGATNDFTNEFLNACDMGGHRYRGMCAEIGTIAWAKSLKEGGQLPSNDQVRWAVYGITDPMRGTEGFLEPCGGQGGRPGCSSYVAEVARLANGGGQCLMRREPEPAPPIRPLKPKPDAPDAPGAPLKPDTPVRPDNTPDGEEGPVRLGQDPKNKPKDDPDAPNNKDKDGFEKGAMCALPGRKPKPASNAGDIPNPSRLLRKLKIRGAGWVGIL